MTHTIVNHVFCAGRRFSLSRQKIELILIHKSVTHRHNNNIKRSRTHTTPLAQRQSAGLIILRSADQNPQEVSFNSHDLQNRAVNCYVTLN